MVSGYGKFLIGRYDQCADLRVISTDIYLDPLAPVLFGLSLCQEFHVCTDPLADVGIVLTIPAVNTTASRPPIAQA